MEGSTVDTQLLVAKLASLAREYDFDRYFLAVAESAQELFAGDGAAFILADGDQQRYLFFHGLPDAYYDYAQYCFPRTAGISGFALSQDQAIFVADYPHSPWAMPEFVALGLCASLAVPVHDRDQCIGTLVVSWFHPPLREMDGQRMQIAATLADMLGVAWYRRNLVQTLEQQAYTDSLTGVLNRHHLEERIAAACSRAQRQQRLLCVLLIDLDHFKDVNDTLGHHAGDQLLREVVNRLRDVLRREDSIVRYAGDEFVLLLEDLRRVNDIDVVCQRILSALNMRVGRDERSVRVTASIGVTVFPFDEDGPELLLQHADQALYRVKADGGNGMRYHDPEMDHDLAQRQRLRGQLARAIDAEEFFLLWQPIIALGTQEIIGAEALLRWQHPELGLLLPGDFLAVLEDSPLIRRLGRWILQQTCTQGTDWQRAGFSLQLHVNLSAREIENHGLCQELRRSLDEHPDFPAEQLCLEIVERVALQDIPKARQLIADCHSLGVHFALDDFGTGNASLQYLLELDCDRIKIDKSFVIPMTSNPRHGKMVQGIIQMSHALGIQVTAEGIEDSGTGLFLAGMGADAGQGFGIARPMPAAALTALLQTSTRIPLR